MLFLEYPKCSTCKKAKNWLESNGVEFEDRHIVENNPTADELKAWYEKSGFPLKKFFNTSGLKYKELGLKEKLPNMTEEEQILSLIHIFCNCRAVNGQGCAFWGHKRLCNRLFNLFFV